MDKEISNEIKQLSKHAKTPIQKKLINFLKANTYEVEQII